MGRKKSETKFNARFLKAAEEWISEHGLSEFGGVKIGTYCEAMGICKATHYNWKDSRPEYVAMLNRAIETYRQDHTHKLYNALMEQALGGYKENLTEDAEYKPNPQDPNKPMIVRKRTHKEKKYVKGDAAAAIFLITNLDPKSFVNRLRTDMSVTGKDGKDLFASKTDEELRDIIADFQRKLD